MPKALNFFLFSFLVLLSGFAVSQEVKIPPLSSPVVDQAGFFNEAERADLSDLAYEIHTSKGPQITVLTVSDLQEFPIEEFSIRVAEQWKLGAKDKGNGLLIIIAKAERKIRIEVGEGIEGDITDYESKEYIDKFITPAFREGKFHAGIRLVMEDVAKQFNIAIKGEQVQYVRRAPVRNSNGLLNKIFPIMLVVLVFGHMILRRRPFARGLFSGLGMAGASFLMIPGVGAFAFVLFLVGFFLGLIGISNFLFAMLAGGGRGRGGFGGGGFGGGGGSWGGGGGGFSGGGSSGSW